MYRSVLEPWYVYIVECSSGHLYTGITKDVSRRVKEHNKGNGSKFTRSRRPVKLMYDEKCESHSIAFKRERQIKKLNKRDKYLLIGPKVK